MTITILEIHEIRKSSGVRSKNDLVKDIYDTKETLLQMAKKKDKQNKATINPDEEAALVNIAVKSMIEDVKSGKKKTFKLEDVLAEEDKRRDLR